ncbi:hypothetical protein L8P41_09305, partial [Enterobacter roggenkampii]|uniref:hypothetical protein n=1 Tax=Enterobacter roggenkampii TaxID=1812935 RepID=UPI00200309D8
VSVGMVRVIRCHRQNMKTNIINGSEVSRLSVAIHVDFFVHVVSDLPAAIVLNPVIAFSHHSPLLFDTESKRGKEY